MFNKTNIFYFHFARTTMTQKEIVNENYTWISRGVDLMHSDCLWKPLERWATGTWCGTWTQTAHSLSTDTELSHLPQVSKNTQNSFWNPKMSTRYVN